MKSLSLPSQQQLPLIATHPTTDAESKEGYDDSTAIDVTMTTTPESTAKTTIHADNGTTRSKIDLRLTTPISTNTATTTATKSVQFIDDQVSCTKSNDDSTEILVSDDVLLTQA